jgi:micrococcal nuclease
VTPLGPGRRVGMARSVRLRSVLAVVLVASVIGWWLGGSRRAAMREVFVVQALDGDTIVVTDGPGRETATIRLLGVDTPETHHPRKPVQCFGPEAAAFTQSRLEGQWVRLEDDVERHDIYGRRLAYVYFHGRLFEDTLLTRGYARLLVIEPNHAHARTMLDEELDAQAARVGLWGACGDS